MHLAITDVYLGVLGLLGVYGLHRVSLLWRFHWPVDRGRSEAGTERLALGGDQLHPDGLPSSEQTPEPGKPPAPHTSQGNTREEGVVVGGRVPKVVVQLPLYNERTVAARLVRCAGELDWPADRLEIQVLDDSSDETSDIVDGEVAALVARGLDARVLRREKREGFKAGALAHGLTQTDAALVCIFDADFVPPADFLRRVVPHLLRPGVGMVQARWEHLNRDESLLTRAQSTLLDGHFVIEHTVRADSGLYFNFNGTAGVWRREAIDAGGGWQYDTLTEDLDLSYRAQMAGWRFVYLPLVEALAEVPPTISSFKSQQFRWAKGSVQVARKLGRRLWTADVSWRVKLEAAAHLTGNVGYPLVLLVAILLPLCAVRARQLGGVWALLFLLSTASVLLFYERSQRALGRSRSERLRDVPSAMALGIGMCVSQTRAVFEGCWQSGGEFVRTPKRGDGGGTGYRASLKGIPGFEILLASWFAWGIVGAIRSEAWGLLPFLILFLWSFAWVGGLSLLDWLRGHRARAA